MVWSSSTTAGQDASAGGDKLARITRHVLWGTEVDISAFHRTGNARVRLGGQGQGSRGTHAFNGIQHGHGPYAAVATNNVGAPFFEPGRESLRIGTIQPFACFFNLNHTDRRQASSPVFCCET